jgi:hypothetical protein
MAIHMPAISENRLPVLLPTLEKTGLAVHWRHAMAAAAELSYWLA